MAEPQSISSRIKEQISYGGGGCVGGNREGQLRVFHFLNASI